MLSYETTCALCESVRLITSTQKHIASRQHAEIRSGAYRLSQADKRWFYQVESSIKMSRLAVAPNHKRAI